MKKPLARLVRATVLLVATVGATAADTLYPSSTSSTPVATGTTATAAATNVLLDGPIDIVCSNASMSLLVTSNSGTISADATGSAWSGCILGGFFPTTISPNHSPPWEVSTSDTSDPYAAQMTGMNYTLGGTQYAGDLVDADLGGTGIVQWANGDPATIEFDDAGTLYDSASNSETMTGAFELQGSAGAWDIHP
jgi:hypothetical protein